MFQLLAPLAIGIAVLVGLFSLVAWLTSVVNAMIIAFIFVSGIMMLVILIQRPKGGGLAGAFGGAGGSPGAVFGSQVGDVLTWVTAGCFLVFLGLAMGLTWAIKAQVADPVGEAAPAQVETPTEALIDDLDEPEPGATEADADAAAEVDAATIEGPADVAEPDPDVMPTAADAVGDPLLPAEDGE